MKAEALQEVLEQGFGSKAMVVMAQRPDHAAYTIHVIGKHFQLSQMIAYDLVAAIEVDGAKMLYEQLWEKVFSYITTGGEKMSDLMELVNACDIVNDPIDDRVKSAMIQADELAALGFKKQADLIREKARTKNRLNRLATEKYIKITDEKIKGFLKKLVERYNEEHTPRNKWSRVNPTTLVDPNSFYVSSSDTAYAPGSLMQYAVSQQHNLNSAMQQMYSNQLSGFGGIGRAVAPEDTYCRISLGTIHASGNGPIGQFAWLETRVADYGAIPPKEVLTKFAAEREKNLFDEYTVATVKGVHDPLLLGRIKGVADRFFLAQWGNDVSLDDVI